MLSRTTDKKQALPLFFKRITVICLYVALFVTHLWSDFYIGNEADNVCHPQKIEKTGVSKYASLAYWKQADKNTSSKPTIRLNKRYQPESGMVPINVYTLPVPAGLYANVPKIGHPTAYLLFAVILARSQRGPPVFV